MLALFNTMSRKIEPFKSISPDEVKLYACGPTVYNFAHIGNLRTYIFEDLLRRTLEHAGYKVEHVMNVTDVGHLQSDADEGDDKMSLAAKKEAKSPWEIAKFYEKAFFEDMSKLHIKKPTIVCRATEHIEEMQDFVSQLEKKGYTYNVDGNVYFRINKFPSYTALSRRNLEELQEGARVEVDKRKENPLDFVLWFSNSKFPNQIMKWPSPWGEGFPGWHIECSAMASKYLGEHFDIHCGGIDHISIHHSNEIAQSEACFGKKWVNWWMHGEFLVLQKDKMAKSAGNFLTLTSLIDKGYDSLHYRYLCLGAHYRSQLIFSFEALDGARNAFESLKNRVLSFKLNPESPKNRERKDQLKQDFFAAMENDLDTPVALSVMWESLKDNSISNTEKLELMKDFDEILGLDVDSFQAPLLDEEHMALIKSREAARLNKDWSQADALRDQLLKDGICIKDTKDGTQWYLLNR
ncbi:MAG: cysteine--tRNA ligase [Myxococcales bacterium]|nr:cysteine--tRNA ligase [Myxococcales bacterium]USN50073.1 MAG: cysteine--tRNA ligase [Myxococcales bacterium]